MVSIRNAEHSDIAALLVLGRMMHAESPRFSPLQYDADKVETLLKLLVDNPHAGGLLVAEDEGVIIGALGFVLQSHFFGPDLFTIDVFIYIVPERRGGRTYPRMVAAYEQAAKQLGACEVIINPSTGVNPAAVVRATERLGYTVFSTGLLKKV